jgi:hypothetical protein
LEQFREKKNKAASWGNQTKVGRRHILTYIWEVESHGCRIGIGIWEETLCDSNISWFDRERRSIKEDLEVAKRKRMKIACYKGEYVISHNEQ